MVYFTIHHGCTAQSCENCVACLPRDPTVAYSIAVSDIEFIYMDIRIQRTVVLFRQNILPFHFKVRTSRITLCCLAERRRRGRRRWRIYVHDSVLYFCMFGVLLVMCVNWFDFFCIWFHFKLICRIINFGLCIASPNSKPNLPTVRHTHTHAQSASIVFSFVTLKLLVAIRYQDTVQ